MAIAPPEPTVLQVQVTDLSWVAEVDIEEQRGYKRESWQSAMPSGATLLKTETRENRRPENRGFRTVMVPEQYQSGTKTETYTELEQYQSGTTTQTDYSSERYQNGTTNETYYESERYQSGTEEKGDSRQPKPPKATTTHPVSPRSKSSNCPHSRLPPHG
jgi:hypothetical protein